MAAYSYDENVKIVLYPEGHFADRSAPTVVELNDNAGIDLSCLLAKSGGWSGNPTFNQADAGRLCQIFDSQTQGTWGINIDATFLRDKVKSKDVAWPLFKDHGQNYEAVLRYGMNHGDAWVDGQDVMVYPVQSTVGVMNEPATNTSAAFSVNFAVTEQPEQHAVVGGGS